MIPYFELASLSLGPFELPVFRSLFLAAGGVGTALVLARLSRAGFEPRRGLAFVAIVAWCALLGSRALDLVIRRAASLPELLQTEPLAVLYFWQSFYSIGAAAGLFVGIALGAWALGLRRRQVMVFLDAVGFALPFAWATARLGCALAHDHLGPASSHWLAVRFPSGPRLDLGVLEWLGMLLVCASFLVLSHRRTWPRGFYLALFFALYAPLRYGIDLFRSGDTTYGDLTAAQIGVTLAAAAALLALARMFGRHGPGEDPAPA